jgi:hypothetical protein
VQAGVVDLLVAHARQHLDVAALEQGAADPAGGLGQAVADLAGLALQQPDLARRRIRRRASSGRRARRRWGRCPTRCGSGRCRSGSGWSPPWVSSSATSKPMPPAPTMATVLRRLFRGGLRARRCSAPPWDGRCREDPACAGRCRWRARRGRSRPGELFRRGAVCCTFTPVSVEAAAEVAERLAELFLAGDALGHVELAADFARGLEQRDVVAALGGGGGEGDMPAGPAPTTALLLRGGRDDTSSVSWQARGLTRQEQVLRSKMWSRQAWLQAMQVLISSARPAAALFTNSESARKGRAIDTMSASPRASTSSATSGR